MSIRGVCARCLIGLGVMLGAPTIAGAIAITSTAPASNANSVARNASVVINFDRAVATASINASTFHVWGTQSGLKAGSTVFSNGNQTLTFTPSTGFFPGEWVSVQVSHSITGADSSPMRSAGYAFQFNARTGPGSMMSSPNGPPISVKLNGDQAEIYGGIASDLNRDGWVDYVAVNEVSHDLRVMLNLADGSGNLGPILTPTTPVGASPSPSTVGDFDFDGFIDLATSNVDDSNVTIAMGTGDGYFRTPQNVAVGAHPHSLAALDFDGDGYLDIAVASEFGGTRGVITLLHNDGTGSFTRVSDFDSGGDGNYGLAAGDMNNDGILDLVVGTADDNGGTGRMIVLLGNGDGTFNVPIAGSGGNIPAGGYVWKIALGDLNNDGKLDVVSANSSSYTGSVVLGNGDGTLQPAQIYSFPGWMLGTTLGDLDGDGDLDWVNSDFGAAEWHVMKNHGDGTFTEVQTIHADQGGNASCATLYDADNNGTLDMALADETLDLVQLMRNNGPSGDQADVAVSMSASPTQYTAGAALSYTITVVNNGPDASPATSVSDAFPAAYDSVTWTCLASGGASCTSAGSGDISESVSIPSGDQVVFTVDGTVASGTTGTLSNTAMATVGAPASDPNTSNNSATINTSPAPLLADVAVTLSSNPTAYTTGAALTYTITVTNAGPSDAANTQVADAFPAPYQGATWSCAASGGASCTAGGTGDIDDDAAIPQGGQVVYTVQGTITEGTSGVLTDTVTAVVGAPASDPNTSNNTATLHTAPANQPDLIFMNGFDGS